MTALYKVNAIRSQLITNVRCLVESQLETWRLVPHLALQADGRDAGLGEYYHAYKYGMWELHIANDNLHHVFIDCDTGDVMFLSFQPNHVFCPVGDDTIVRLANHVEYLDAELVVKLLQSKIQKPIPSWISPEEAGNREVERTRIQREFTLAERYVREKVMEAT